MNQQGPPQVYEKKRRSSAISYIPNSILRFLQFASTSIVLGLIAFALHSYHNHGSRRANFALAVGAIGVFYCLAVFFLTLIAPQLVLGGIFLIAEIIMTLLFLCGFIVAAKVFGQHSCGTHVVSSYNPAYGSFADFQSTGGQYDPFKGTYTTKSYTNACRSSKASIAFLGLAFVLSAICCILIGIRVLMPIIRDYGSSGIWKSGTSIGAKLQRATGLDLSTRPGRTYGTGYRQDVETAGMPPEEPGVSGMTTQNHRVVDQHTLSTGESTTNTYNQEKYNEPQGVPNRRVESGNTAVNTGINTARGPNTAVVD
ncbi:hypothetical protein KAFR_0F00340 [Kazachstania africana CBS 2517]|uniref:MARVEL domain-containing protein n=1 Tax=Kazachstania africana (strain ATCC 22294 / BCRC 22015 / CBS 2517 / CECT 1963 / NBRC 1671 / NRRL Y-8276) TaxID=1071382 RepID=H2AW81_KAZAF|nr:hypothetical protein KAFR_0F00340 [Kazachstania africana CBS 2517]CCF58631.1 hypothetical protein KAFR_0F00340 [Kazachstania africana CBS 2517]